MFDIFDWFISWHPHIFISLGSCVLAYILASLHPRIFRLIYRVCIPASSYPQVRVCLLVSLHPHILVYPQVYVCLLVCSHRQVNVFSIKMNNCILASSSSNALDRSGFCLKLLPQEQENWSETAIESQSKKKVVKILAKTLKSSCEGINLSENLHSWSLQVY